MEDTITTTALIFIALGSLYLLWSARFEEGIIGHLALATGSGLSLIGIYQINILHESLKSPPLITGILICAAIFLCWYDIKLWRAGERRHTERLNQERRLNA